MLMKLRTLVRGVLPGFVALGLLGCGDDGRSPGAGNGPDERPPLPGACLQPAEGCPCPTEGAVSKCGVTVSKQEDTLTCREGERTCADGTWSECLGEKLTQIYSAPSSAPGLRPQALDTTAEDCGDKCEPYCRTLADTPEDLNAGPDFTADPSGLTLHTEGFTSGNCPDVVITPETATLEITSITEAAGVVTITPNFVKLAATCGAGGISIDPSWKTDVTDRSWVKQDGTVTVSSPIAGPITVTGSSVIDDDTAVVTVKVNVNEADAAVTNTIKTEFAGAGTGTDPGITLYPYNETIFPLDLKAPVVQWSTGGVTATHVEVSLRYPAGATNPAFWYSKIFAGQPTQGPVNATAGAPAWAIPQAVWTAFGRTANGNTGEIIVQRRTAAGVYQPRVIRVKFATAPLRGTVYYTQYIRSLFTPGAGLIQSPQADLPTTYDPLAPGTTICPVGNSTHKAGSTTRAIDMSTPTANNIDPFNGAQSPDGCPVCHSVSANGNVYVAGSRFLQQADNIGFVNNIGVTSAGATFTPIGEAPNYATLRSATSDWDSRGFAFAALTPDGALALQGPGFWGNSQNYGGNNLTIDRAWATSGWVRPMFFVPTAVNGANVRFATTAALAATRTGNVLSSAVGVTLPQIDGVTMVAGDSVLVKDQVNKKDNGIYEVTTLGGCGYGADLTTLTTLAITSTSVNGTNTAAKAFDNDTATRWESAASDPQSITVDLGSSKMIGRVRIDWEAASSANYTIQIATALAGPWTTIATVTGAGSSNHRIDDLRCLSGTGRYVRMLGTVRSTTFGHSIWEMDVYAPGATGATAFSLTRRSDAQTPATYDGTIKKDWEVRVIRGNANYAKVFRLTAPASDPTINTSDLTFTDINASALPVMTMPAISPDGTKIVYVNGDSDPITVAMTTQTTAWRKGLTMLSFNQTTRQTSNKTRLVNNWVAGTGGTPIKWPFFEHDSRSVIFVETDPDEWCRSATDSSTDMGRACFGDGMAFANTAPTQRGYWPGRLVSLDSQNPAATKTVLTKLSNGENTNDYAKAFQPTVLPFASGGYRWVLFTSPRSYGNQLNQIGASGPTHFSCAATLLWIAAVDDATAGATDRSHPAFLLPGQNLAPITQENHYLNERGYLVPSPCKGSGLTCETNDECCGTNKCQVDTISASGVPTKVCKDPVADCSNEGEACLTNADCCGSAPCNAQKCQLVPTFAASTFQRTFVANCASGFKPLWGDFSYHLTNSNGSHIHFTAQTAAAQADLASAAVVDLKDETGSNFGAAALAVDVGKELEDDKVSPYLNYLRVSMKFYPSSGGAVSPTLHDWEQRFSCLPAE